MKKSNKVTRVIILALAVILAGGGLTAFFLVKHKDVSAEENLSISENFVADIIKDTSEEETDKSTNIVTAAAEAVIEEEYDFQERASLLSEEQELEMYNTYASALACICEGAIWADDTSRKVCDYLGCWNYINAGQKATNNFAIADVDNDGIKELIVEINNASAADKITVIYQYDISTGSLYREASFYPGAVFYDNDIVFDEWSENTQGNGDYIWPYSVYKYDSAQDAYLFICQVDSWSNKIRPENFPEGIDADGDGNIVVITASDETLYLDNGAYFKWITGITEGSNEKYFDLKPMYNANYIDYAWDYAKYKVSAVKAKYEGSGEVDLGVIYACNKDYYDCVTSLLADSYDIRIENKKTKAGNENFYKNGDELVYLNDISDICIFGSYPGMKEDAAVNAIAEYGFKDNGFGAYCLGSTGWHIEIYFEIENEIVTAVHIKWTSDYSGTLQN